MCGFGLCADKFVDSKTFHRQSFLIFRFMVYALQTGQPHKTVDVLAAYWIRASMFALSVVLYARLPYRPGGDRPNFRLSASR